jgi:spore coat protein U-like protein
MARVALLAGVLVAGGPVSAQAESASALMEVSLVVEPSCHVSATPMAFGGQAGQSLEASSNIRIACNDDTAIAVRLDGGLHSDGMRRRLAGEGGQVEYAGEFDAARSLEWSPGSAASGTAGAAPLTLAAYGRIDAAATLAGSGAYRDSITVTVDF